MSDKFEKKLDEVYESSGDRQKLDRAYDKWSQDYDRDLWASGNPYIALIAAMAGRYIENRDARIMDGGCGTGNLGYILKLVGYGNIVGLDASAGMLEAARAKNCYVELHQKLLGAVIDLPAESFDAVTAAGVFTQGHAPPESLDGLLALAKPGAPVIFSISRIAMEEGGFGEKILELDRKGLWVLEEQSELFRTYPFSARYETLRHWISVYRKSDLQT